MGIIAEAITLLQYKAFQKNEAFDININILGIEEIEQDIENVKDLLYSTENSSFVQAWETYKSTLSPLQNLFNEFQASSESNENVSSLM